MKNKKLVFAADHAGVALKEKLIMWAKTKGFETEDLGPNTNKVPSSYAKQGLKLAKNVLQNKNKIGVGICGTGLGISFAVNRVKGIRGARITTKKDAQLAKQHNNANILLLSGTQVSLNKAIKMMKAFMKTTYEGGRHEERINDLDK